MTNYVVKDEHTHNIVTAELIQRRDGIDLMLTKGIQSRYLGKLKEDGTLYLCKWERDAAKDLGIQLDANGHIVICR